MLAQARFAVALLAVAAVQGQSTTYCTDNAACTWNGDSDATCSIEAGACMCSGNSTGVLCQVGGGGSVARTTVQMLVSVTLPAATCSRIEIASLTGAINTRLQAASLPLNITTACGSLTVVVHGNLTTASLDAQITSVVAVLGEAIVQQSGYTGVLSAASLAFSVDGAQPLTSSAACDVNAVTSALTHDGRCLVIECAEGYRSTRNTTNGMEYTACELAPTPAPTGPYLGDGNGMSGGEVAGVAVGGVLLAGVFVGLIVFCLRDSKQQPQSDNEPTSSEP